MNGEKNVHTVVLTYGSDICCLSLVCVVVSVSCVCMVLCVCVCVLCV